MFELGRARRNREAEWIGDDYGGDGDGGRGIQPRAEP